MTSIRSERADQILSSMKAKRVAVVGDVMLDRYFIGNVSRISPEAPVPVIDIEGETFHLGGAANVAQNLHSLGVEPLLCGVIGDDNSGRMFIDIAQESGLNTSTLVSDSSRVTTVKTRIIGNNQHIARVDREVRGAISESTAMQIVQLLSQQQNLDAIIFEDYNKGVITSELINAVRQHSDSKGIPVFVDPKLENFFSFKGATVFKPNRKEAQEALGYALHSDEDIHRAGTDLLQRLHCENVLLTLGAKGMMLFERSGEVLSIPTFALHVADVSGAGDTAIATLVAAFAGGASIREAAILSNVAAGVVCGEPGVVSIEPNKIMNALSHKM